MRQLPNVVITGTPGVGKTTHCESLATRLDLRHISVNQVVKDKNCHEGWSDEYQSYIVDEDKVPIPAFCKDLMEYLLTFCRSCLMQSRSR